jgi:hypothetical protein
MKKVTLRWLNLGFTCLPAIFLFGFSLNSLAQIKVDEITLNSDPNTNIAFVGDSKFLLHVPQGLINSGKKLPVLFLMSGFQTSDGLIQKMASDVSNNILVVFKYPFDDKQNWTEWVYSDQKTAERLAFVSLQAFKVLKWLTSDQLEKNYGVSADTEKINTIAISLGVFFLPSAVLLAQEGGVKISSVTYAFCGARLDFVVETQIKESKVGFLASLISPALKLLVSPFEPLNFVSKIESKVLILNATEDQIFKKESQMALSSAVPIQNRTVIEIPGNHIGLKQDERIKQSFGLIYAWLIERAMVAH